MTLKQSFSQNIDYRNSEITLLYEQVTNNASLMNSTISISSNIN